MAKGYVIPMDPSEFSNRFYLEAKEEEPEEPELVEGSDAALDESLLEDPDYEKRIEPLLDRIPKREADLIWLYFIQKKRQADIAAIFNVSQAAISYRLDRGIKRIKFFLSIPPLEEAALLRDLSQVLKPLDVRILLGMWQTTCQSLVAKKLGITQGRVRHRFFKLVGQLKEWSQTKEYLKPYSQVFSAIAAKNFNLGHEVKLPQWSDRGRDECF